MVARHPQVGKQSVESFHSVVAHPVLEISEVAPHECEVVLRTHVLFRIRILVEAVQVSATVQLLQYSAAVTATAERHVDVCPVMFDVKSADALFEQYRHVICIDDGSHCFI